MRLTPGTVVAERFELEGLLGRGGMGSVWRARHLRLDIPCAVKFIEGVYAHSPEANQRFEREAKAAALLRSTHVVQILDHGVWEEMPYIAMELLEGEDLGKRLARVGKLSGDETLSIVDQVARALTRAHQAGVVHRDLKPDNLFLVHEGEREIVKVLDFGVAKRSEPQGVSVTRDGAVIGTPTYMSPEQARGLNDIDARSDLWSLAVIVYECITGRLPFDSEAVGDLMMQVIAGPIPVPSSVASIPGGFDAWWARAASRDRSARFQTARELHDELAVAFGKPRPHPATPLPATGDREASARVAGVGQGRGDPHAATVLRRPHGEEAAVAVTLAPLSQPEPKRPADEAGGPRSSAAKRIGLVAAAALALAATAASALMARHPPPTETSSVASAMATSPEPASADSATPLQAAAPAASTASRAEPSVAHVEATAATPAPRLGATSPPSRAAASAGSSRSALPAPPAPHPPSRPPAALGF